jgi:glutathione S-transferase
VVLENSHDQSQRATLGTAVRPGLEGRDYLEGRFTAGDLLMTTVLRSLRHTDLIARLPILDRYRQRCEGRPAFQKPLADQLTDFAANAPAAA